MTTVSPGSTSTRATRSTTCCAPLTTATSSGSHSMPRLTSSRAISRRSASQPYPPGAEASLTDVRREEAVARETLVRRHDRDPGEPERGRELAAGGQLGPRRQAVGFDEAA